MARARIELDAVSPLLAQLGFRKRSGGIFTRELVDDVLGWIGLNRATEHVPAGHVDVNPVVGIRHQGIERLVAELRGDRYHAYVPPTLSISLGYLLPEKRYLAWRFTPSTASAEASAMVGRLAAGGLPFMNAHSELGPICAAMDARLGIEPQLVYRRPAAWFLAGHRDRAADLLDVAEKELGDRNDLAAVELRRFVAAFRARLGDPGQ